jgi:hypothetical protein
MKFKTIENMKTTMTLNAVVFFFLMISASASAQTASTTKSENQKTMKTKEMKMYVIEREIPNAGKLTPEELKAISQTSCSVLKEMGPRIEWVHSYVTDNKIFCIYRAENEEALREHARKGGFPINVVSPVATIISPTTASL